jgi:hypothetical protein
MPSGRGGYLLRRSVPLSWVVSPLQAILEGVRSLLNRVVGRHLKLSDDASLWCELYALPF